MKLRHAIWFWAGAVVAVTGTDAIFFIARPHERFPGPLAAIPLWMVLALFPAGIFYVSGRSLEGMFPRWQIPDGNLKFIFMGILYVLLCWLDTSFLPSWERALKIMMVYLGPTLFCALLARRKTPPPSRPSCFDGDG
jgi:hypothetical protein